MLGLRDSFDTVPRASGDPEAPGLSQPAISALACLDIDSCRAALADLEATAPDLAAALRRELPLAHASRDQGRAEDLSIPLWRVLDERSPIAFRPAEGTQPPRGDAAVPEASAADQAMVPRPDALYAKVIDGPEPAGVKGRTLEEGLRAILSKLFDLENASGWSLRKQDSGSQFGFDVSFSAQDALRRSQCFFECKNYSAKISLATVSDKVLQAEGHWRDAPVDHWILVSPHTDPVNELDLMIERWNSERFFSFMVQVWSPANGVRDLFQLDRGVHAAIYGSEPDDLSEDRRSQIVEDFRRRLEPPLRIPKIFAGYVVNAKPVLLPTDEASWPILLGGHIPRTALTEAGAPVSSSLLETASQWCLENQRMSSAMLLLAEFGEGKSFFTYELCANLLSRHRMHPAEWPLPLRFTLRDFRRIDSPKEFLDLELGHYGAKLSDFGDLRRRSSIILILDGVDEMSVRQDGLAITENLQKLQELLEMIGDTPVLFDVAAPLLRIASAADEVLRPPSTPDRVPLRTAVASGASGPPARFCGRNRVV